MKSRYFWEKANYRKYSIVFEAEDYLVGRDERNRFKTFRKDTGLISFSEIRRRGKLLSAIKANRIRRDKKNAKNSDNRRGSNRDIIGLEFA